MSLDDVDDADRRLHAILMRIAETAPDAAARQKAQQLAITMPPIRDWPASTVREVYEHFTFLNLTHDLRRDANTQQPGGEVGAD